MTHFYDNLIKTHADEYDTIDQVFQFFQDVENNIRNKLTNEHMKSVNNEQEFAYWLQLALL